jgi:hypothetical protein
VFFEEHDLLPADRSCIVVVIERRRGDVRLRYEAKDYPPQAEAVVVSAVLGDLERIL